MSKTKGVRVLVEQFLSAAADQIVEAVEEMISGYEQEMFQSKRKISGQRKLLDALLQPEIRLNGLYDEAQLSFSVREEDLLTEQQQEWNSCEVSVKQFLSVAAERIMKAVEKMISGYMVEMHQAKREIGQQCKILNALLQPEIRMDRMPSTAEQMPIVADEDVPSPGFSESENEDDDDWNAAEDGDSDRSEEQMQSGEHCTQTANTPQTKKWEKSCICKVCGKSFHYKGSFLKHLESHPRDECGLCGMHFKTEDDFELHLRTHKNEYATRRKAKEVCDVCGKCFTKPEILKTHMRRHTGEKPNLKIVVCDVCGKCFTNNRAWTFHMRNHTGERPYTCEVCGKSFKIRTYMTEHLRTHTGQKPFKCSVCGKSFSTHQSLFRHHYIHAGDTQYTCTICSEHFISYSTLRKHTRTHLKHNKSMITSNTPVYDDEDVDANVITKDQLVRITCKVCGKDFHSKVSVVNHMESHPKDDCGLCGMHFNTEEDFELHLKTHKDEIAKVCDVCGKCFSKPFYLDVHMRGHTGEKRFKCSVCDKAFRQRSCLKKHTTIHTGEKPFSCTTCSKCFSTKSNLVQHKKRCRII